VKMMSGAAMVVEALKDVGVSHVFGYPGGAVLDIYDALFAQDAVKHVLVRHEQGASHMADGYARATGKTGTVLVTSGPGATNTLTGIATAFMDSIPMVVLSGQVPSMHIGEDAFQETDMVGCSRPVVKHSFLVKKATDIPKAIAQAYYIANTGRPGPVVVDLPKDLVNVQDTHPYVFPDDVSMRSYNPTLKGHNKQDIDPASISKIVNAHVPVVGSVKTVVEQLLANLAEHDLSEQESKLSDWWGQINTVLPIRKTAQMDQLRWLGHNGLWLTSGYGGAVCASGCMLSGSDRRRQYSNEHSRAINLFAIQLTH